VGFQGHHRKRPIHQIGVSRSLYSRDQYHGQGLGGIVAQRGSPAVTGPNKKGAGDPNPAPPNARWCYCLATVLPLRLSCCQLIEVAHVVLTSVDRDILGSLARPHRSRCGRF
jgi:hypothetical protein